MLSAVLIPAVEFYTTSNQSKVPAESIRVYFSGNHVYSIESLQEGIELPDVSGMVFLTGNEFLKYYVIIVKSKRIFSFDDHYLADLLMRNYDAIKNCDKFEDMVTIAKMCE